MLVQKTPPPPSPSTHRRRKSCSSASPPSAGRSRCQVAAGFSPRSAQCGFDPQSGTGQAPAARTQSSPAGPRTRCPAGTSWSLAHTLVSAMRQGKEQVRAAVMNGTSYFFLSPCTPGDKKGKKSVTRLSAF